MRKCIITSIIVLFLFSIGCTQRPTPYFAPPSTVQKVYNHIVSIAVYYYMPPEEWEKRVAHKSSIARVDVDTDETFKGKPIKCLAYIGSGTLLRKNHVITVRHLFDHDDNTYARKIWVFHQQVDHAMEADLIAVSSDEDYDDYAVVKLRENLGLPGLPISRDEPQLGEKVMFGCSVGGTAYFLRFAYVTNFKWFMQKDERGRLHLSKWAEYHFTTVHPSGPGDSGSSIVNTKGQIVGIVYIGVNIYEEIYSFSNPVQNLWDFLKEHHLEYLGARVPLDS